MHNYIVGQMKVIVYTFYQPILASADNCIRISLHYYIEEQIKVIVYTFYQLYILQGLIFASEFSLHNYIEWKMKVIV